jgi:hypothetical protein
VRDENKRRVPPSLLGENQVDNRSAGLRVEVARRLVSGEDQRVGRERPGERHALLLAAG